MSSPSRTKTTNEKFSWSVAKAKGILNQAQIERLAGLALIHLNEMNIDYVLAATELGQASPGAVRTSLFDIKKKLRENGAVIGAAAAAPASPASIPLPATPTPKKGAGGRKRKSMPPEDDEETPKGKGKGKKVKVEKDEDEEEVDGEEIVLKAESERDE